MYKEFSKSEEECHDMLKIKISAVLKEPPQAVNLPGFRLKGNGICLRALGTFVQKIPRILCVPCPPPKAKANK